MSDYKERLEKKLREAKERFEEIDEQIGLSDKLSEGAKAAKETAKKGAETLRESAEKIKQEAEKSEVGKQAVKVAEDTYKTAERVAGDTAKKAWDASEPVREVAEDAGEKAGEVFESASQNTGDVIKIVGERAGEVFNVASQKAGEFIGGAGETIGSTAKSVSKALGLGASWTRTINSAVRSFQQTADWVQEKPLQAAATGTSVVVGAGLGVAYSTFSSHWLFNSTITSSTVKLAADRFNDYQKSQTLLAGKGELTDAEAEKLAFERDITKYVGAPLLGAFSFASGVVLMTNVLNPKTITGAPIDWLLGGNPVLEGVWFFGNGMVCFKTSYDFFMISLEDNEEVQKMVREVKGLLPQVEQTEPEAEPAM